MRLLRSAVQSLFIVAWLLMPAHARADPLLDETVGFASQILFLEAKAPALVVGVVRDGEMAVYGYGETSKGSGKAPDGDTILRIGSISKAFAGHLFASLAADGTVGFTDTLQDRLDWDVAIPDANGRQIRLIDLATHSAGLPREVEREPGPPDNPFATLTEGAYRRGIASQTLLFTPGAGMLYSNFGFDLLGIALAASGGKPYDTLLKERVLDPGGLKDTMLVLREGDEARLLQGHDFDGTPLPNVPTTPVMAAASGLYSTPNDILRWLAWHLDRSSAEGADVRLLDHAAWLSRDGLDPVAGLDEAGHMNAMGLGWILMEPEGDRPLILQKSGGLQGIFNYVAFAPSRGVGIYVAISQFNTGAFAAMTAMANDLIAELAPR